MIGEKIDENCYHRIRYMTLVYINLFSLKNVLHFLIMSVIFHCLLKTIYYFYFYYWGVRIGKYVNQILCQQLLIKYLSIFVYF
mgnify:CR=1 FL=1